MTFRKIISLILFLFFICIGSTNVNADDMTKQKKNKKQQQALLQQPMMVKNHYL